MSGGNICPRRRVRRIVRAPLCLSIFALTVALAVSGCGGKASAVITGARSGETTSPAFPQPPGERPPRTFTIRSQDGATTYQAGVAREGDSIVCIWPDGTRTGTVVPESSSEGVAILDGVEGAHEVRVSNSEGRVTASCG